MTSSEEKGSGAIRSLKDFKEDIGQSLSPLRWAGYLLLFLALMDWIVLFIPLDLLNPVWEFQTLGQLVERVPVLLIAFALIFFGGGQSRGPKEKLVTVVLSWLCLLIGIFFFLLVPLGVLNTYRINQQNAIEMTAQFNQELDQANLIQEQLDQAEPEEIVAYLESQGLDVEGQSPEEVKDLLLEQLEQVRLGAEQAYTNERQSQRVSLIKNSVKWNLGAILSGTFLIYLWRSTRWTREA